MLDFSVTEIASSGHARTTNGAAPQVTLRDEEDDWKAMNTLPLGPFGTAARDKLVYLAVPPILLGAFWGAFGLQRFGDAWQYVHAPMKTLKEGTALDFITSRSVQHWSPLWQTVEVVNYLVAGFTSDVFVRSLNLLIQALSLVALARLCLHWHKRTIAVLAAMLVLGLHHVSAGPLYHFDNTAYLATDCLGWWGVVLLIQSLGEQRRRVGPAPLVLLAIGLLFREQCLAAAAIYIWVLFWSWWTTSNRKVSWRRAAYAVMPTFAVVLIFAAARHWIGRVPLQLEGAFRLSPADTPRNMVQMLTALLSPVRTLAWFDAYRSDPRHWGILFLLAGALCIVLTCILLGLRFCLARNRHASVQVGLVVGGLVLSWFPTALMSHVGEAYAHTSLFWFAMLVGLAVDGWLNAYPKRSSVLVLVTVLVAYVTSLASGLRSNLFEMRQNGERSNRLMAGMKKAVSVLTPGTVVQVCDIGPLKRRTDYSMYRTTTFRELTFDIETSRLPTVMKYFGFQSYFIRDICRGSLATLDSLRGRGTGTCILVANDTSFSLEGCPPSGDTQLRQ